MWLCGYCFGDPNGVANLTALSSGLFFVVDLSTHPSMLIHSLLVSISSYKARHGLLFVIASAGLLLPLIHLTSVISCRSYDWRRYMRSIIRRFSCIVPSLTRHLYRLFKSVQTISSNGSVRCRSCVRVDLIAAAVSNLLASAYVSKPSTLRIIRLHFVDD